MTVGERREVWLVRSLDQLHPSYREPLRQIGARVYDLSVSGEPSVRVVGGLYVSFLHALCEEAYQVFAYHLFIDVRTDAVADLVGRLKSVEPSTQLTSLTRRDLRAMGLRGVAPQLELTFATRRRGALETLFGGGEMFLSFGDDWLLGRLGSPFPLQFLRRSYFEKDTVAASLAAIRDFPAMVTIREFHGPLLFTIQLADEEVVSAAERTASELGYPFRSK